MRCASVLVWVMIAAMSLVAERAPAQSNAKTDTIEKIVADLASADEAKRAAAEERLGRYSGSGMTADEAIVALEAAGRELPDARQREALVYAAREVAERTRDERLIGAVERVFPKLTARGKAACFGVLEHLGTEAAARKFALLLAEHGDELEGNCVIAFEFGDGARSRRLVKAMFPRVLEATKHRDVAALVYGMCLSVVQAGMQAPGLAEHEAAFAAQLKAEHTVGLPMQKDEGHNWKYEREYDKGRSLMGIMLDLAGYMKGEESIAAVEACGNSKDPYHRLYRALTLLRRGKEVGDVELAWIAEHARERYWLAKNLELMGRKDRWPGDCRDQGKLAEGDMVQWLCFGTELGREPDEIELVHKETRQERDEAGVAEVDYYFFKFRVTEEHWSKDDGWMVGMAGGYRRDEQPTMHGVRTFSHFDKLGEKTMAEHVKALVDR